MADLATLNNVYNHYMTAYAPMGSNSKYDTHKKSELRGVYNSIVKINKDAPVFLIDNSQETKAFAVNLKESARSLKNTISSLTVDNNDDLLSKKTVASSNSSIIDATYIGSIEQEDNAPTIEVGIKQLASEQINTGKFLSPDDMQIRPDTYSFDIRSRDIDYEFQFNINDDDTNRSIQEKLSRLIQRANIGIKAETVSDGQGNVALKLTSDETGVKGTSGLQFVVSDDKTSKSRGAVDYFGIDNVSSAPSNAIYTIDGDEQSSPTNTVTFNKIYELDFKNKTSDENITIGLKTDVESLTDNISNLIMGYNTFIQSAARYLDSQPYSKALVREMNSISSLYGSEFESMGLNVEDDGQISLDVGLVQQTADESDAMERFENIKKFANNVLDKANAISLDPMQYAQKKVVAYKNPGHNFASPYVTSNYSGMLFSSYC